MWHRSFPSCQLNFVCTRNMQVPDMLHKLVDEIDSSFLPGNHRLRDKLEVK